MKQNYTFLAALMIILTFSGVLAAEFYINEPNSVQVYADNTDANLFPDLPPVQLHAMRDFHIDADIQPFTAALPVASNGISGRNAKKNNRNASIYEFRNLIADRSTNGHNVNFEGRDDGIETSQDYLGFRCTDHADEHTVESKKTFLPAGLGAQIGYSRNSLSHTPGRSTTIGGVNVELLTNIGLGKRLLLQPGIRYTTAGINLINNYNDGTQERLRLHYIQIPADFVYSVARIGHAGLQAGAGPYIAYLAGSKDHYASGDDVLPATMQRYYNHDLNKMDWGLDYFVSLQADNGWFWRVGGNAGLANVSNTSSNYNFGLSVGYIFGGR